jgi:hypothetical protein
MKFPPWLGDDGRQLVVTASSLDPLRNLLDVLAPGASEPVPVTITHHRGDIGGEQTYHGSAPLWGQPDTRFAITVDGAGAAVAMHAYKAMAFAADLHLPGIEHDTLWMIVEADTRDGGGVVNLPDGTTITVLRRHLFGVVAIGGVSQYVRVEFSGDDLIAEIDLGVDLSAIEKAILHTETGQSAQGPGPGQPLDLLHLAPLLGTDHDPHGDLRWLPEPLRQPDLLTLHRFGFVVSPDGAEKLLDASVTLGIADSGRWVLIPGFPYLSIGDITAALGVRHPLDPRRRRPHVALRGVIGLGKARLGVETRWPDLAVSGELIDGSNHPLTVSELLAAVHLPPLPQGPKIEVLTIQARPAGVTPTLSIRATASDLLSIPIGTSSLDLRQLGLSLDLARGEERSLDAEITAVVTIGGVELLADASTIHDSDGWQLTARLGANHIGVEDLTQWIAARFGDHPLPAHLIPSANITDLAVGYDTATGDASFRIATAFTLFASAGAGAGTSGRQLELDVHLAHHGGHQYQRVIEGRFSLGDHHFELVDATDGTAGAGAGATGTGGAGAGAAEMLVGRYRHSGTTVTVGDLLAAAGLVLPIGVDVADAVIGHSKGATLCLVDMTTGFDLAGLPLVGRMLTGDTRLGLDLRVLVTSGQWDQALVEQLNAHLGSEIEAILPPEKNQTLQSSALVASVTIAEEAVHLPALGVALDVPATPTGSPPAAGSANDSLPVKAADKPESGVTWVPIQRSLGPVHARRLGVAFDVNEHTIELLVDADLSLGGFTLALQGLGVKSPINRVAPTFSLQGLGLEVNSDAYEIGGVFLRTGPESFAGAATIRTEEFALSAIGAYMTVDGHPSVFLYAVLDYPLGGPAFFFVTGLAAGFGYNRRLIMPGPDSIAEFPLVREAVAGTGAAELPSAEGIGAKLAELEAYLPASNGELFFAIGIKFNSFRLIDSFVLAAVSIGAGGSDVRIDVLGLSTLVLPSPDAGRAVDPLAEIQIALHAQILPTQGFVGVDARLTSASYVLSRDCHLRGGAAFYAWFGGDHAGDFVATLGGYHPRFRAPSHYPKVPRLSFSWHVSRQLKLKGSMYCALIPNALMAGGSLEASYVDGSIHASFRTGADFLLSWQPYYYSASMYISVAARWHCIHGEFGARLAIWGPDFAGNAEIDLGLTSFTVAFGHHHRPLTTVDWSTFRSTSLPKAHEVCSVVCQAGLVRQLEPEDGLAAEWVVSAHDLVIEASSRIPASRLRLHAGGVDEVKLDAGHDGYPAVGVGPVGVHRGGLSSHLDIEVSAVAALGNGDPGFRSSPVTKAVPAALWGDPHPQPDPNGERTIGNALAGYRIRPRSRDRDAQSVSGPHAMGDGGTKHPVNAVRPFWASQMIPVDDDANPTPADVAARDRAELLAGLGIDPREIRPGGDVTASLEETAND